MFVTDVVRLPRTSDDTPRTSFNGGLRGYTVMIITFPHQDGMVERVNISERKTASHIIQYGQRPLLDYTEANLSRTTWQALEDTRQTWCDNPPEPAQPIDQTKVYSIAIDCNRVVNPIIYLRAEQFPPALRELFAVVPAPPTPRPR